MHRKLIRTGIHTLGILAACRALHRRGLRILMYHRFPRGPAALRQQCEHIRRHYHPVSLAEVAESLHGGTPLPANAVAVTVDDGYRDFVTDAHPIFCAYSIPTAVFVVTDFLDGTGWLWHDAVTYALAHTRRRDVPIDRAAFCERLKNVPVPERERAVAALLVQLEVELPGRPPDEHAPMTWDDARRIAADGVEIGVHTKTHPILSQVQDRDRLREEIVASKARIEAELGRPALHFCYPNGRRQDFTAEVVDLVRTTGYLTAVTTERGINFAGTTPFMLRRLGAEPDNPMPYFAELLAGVRTS